MSNKKRTLPGCGRPESSRYQTEMEALLRLARHDPDTFIKFCFNEPAGAMHEQADIHTQLQMFLSTHDRALVELPRDHGKTFQVCGRVLWELGRNPSLRVRIVCATDAIARERSQFLRNQIAGNRRLDSVFPQLKPGEPWTEPSFTVQRSARIIGPSVSFSGVGGVSTGRRADLLICDDIVDAHSLHSKTDRDRVAEYFENDLMNLLEPDGRFWGLFTPWHGDDLNARLKRRDNVYALFRHAIDEDLTPLWPERWPRERLEERLREIGPASFARGYRLQPVTREELVIPAEWVQFWTEPAEYETIVLAVDPAVSTHAKADASALVVLGRVRGDAPQPIRILDAFAVRLTAPDLMWQIEQFDLLWKPHVILFESNAAFAGIRDLLVRHASFGPKVRGESQTRDKGSRAAGFSVPVRNGSVRLRGDGRGGVHPGQQQLFDEMTMFPFADHDDLLDAAMMGFAYLLGRPEPRIWG